MSDTDPLEPLFPYQEEGAAWLTTRKTALLADEMGLGKTAQAITAADTLGLTKILVVCPAVARINWVREFHKWSIFDREFYIPMGLRRLKVKPSPEVSMIVSYDRLTFLESKDSGALKGPWDLLILDEAHFLKSPNAKRTRAILGKGGVVHRAKRTWALTGTPMPNHPGELWTTLFTFGATALTHDEFERRFCNYYEGSHGRVITGANLSRVDELKSLLSKIMLRRRKDEVMKQLPPIQYAQVYVEANEVDLEVESSFVQYIFPKDRRSELKDQLAKESLVMDAILGRGGPQPLQGSVHLSDALAGISQSVSTLRRYVGLQKVEAAIQIIEAELDMNAYEKVVIFAIHADVIKHIRIRLSKFKAVTLFGGTPADKRQKNIDRFQNTRGCRVFIGNIQACGTAITLTAAHNVVFVEQSFVPADNAQAAMRCHRIGQTKPVYVRFITLENSFDERVVRILKNKTRDLLAVFSGAQHILGTQQKNEFSPLKDDDLEENRKD